LTPHSLASAGALPPTKTFTMPRRPVGRARGHIPAHTSLVTANNVWSQPAFWRAPARNSLTAALPRDHVLATSPRIIFYCMEQQPE
jgi:hypothetical protein